MNLQAANQIASKKRSLIKAVSVLSAFVFIAFAVMVYFAWQQHGMIGVLAAALSTAVCWGSSVAALGLTYRTAGTSDALSGALGGTFLRTGVPMAFGIIGSQFSPQLAAAGLLGMTMLMFLLTLAVETTMAVGIVSASQTTPLESSGAVDSSGAVVSGAQSVAVQE